MTSPASVSRPIEEAAYADLLSRFPCVIADVIEAAMREPWRLYHWRWHLGRMWRLHLEHGSREWDADLAIGIAFHDVVYLPTAHRFVNEFESAATLLRHAPHLLSRVAAPNMPSREISRSSRISNWILASADHLGEGAAITPEVDALGAWFLDLDLEPMASPEFGENTGLIRSEYAFVPDDAFEAGRQRFLRGIQAAPFIFRTGVAKNLGWEQAARSNIARSLGPARLIN